MSKSLVSDTQSAFAPKPRSQQLLEDAAVEIKDEALTVALKLIEQAQRDISQLLSQLLHMSLVASAIETRFERLRHDIEGL
jgi:predicted HTH domain antitoxin